MQMFTVSSRSPIQRPTRKRNRVFLSRVEWPSYKASKPPSADDPEARPGQNGAHWDPEHDHRK